MCDNISVSFGAREETNVVQCDWCLNLFKSRGLKLHKTHCKQRPHQQTLCKYVSESSTQLSIDTDYPSTNSEVSIETILINRRKTACILKRLPKGARQSAAEALVAVIEECLLENSVSAWKKLLLFASSCFRVPVRREDRQVSLATQVKQNIKDFIEQKEDSSSGLKRKIKARKNLEKDAWVRVVESKIAEGNVKEAIRIICSKDTFITPESDTADVLRGKHPPPERSHTDFPLEPTASDVTPLRVDAAVVRGALSTFPTGSAGGLDSLTPQHLKDLTAANVGATGTALIASIAKLCNWMLSGQVPSSICPTLYGAYLCALKKKSGGIRPIAVGNVFRRLTAKLGCFHIKDRCGVQLRPVQLGFGVRGGAEAAAHAVRLYVSQQHSTNKCFLKIDFSNAFNMLRRDKMLSMVVEELPELYPFLSQCYRHPTHLVYGQEILLSQRGIQQGDPLGPALFCKSLLPVAREMKSELNVWYLDDATLAGSPEVLLEDVNKLKDISNDWGLGINPEKCELAIIHQVSEGQSEIISLLQKELPGVRLLEPEDWELLGAPLTAEAMAGALERKTRSLRQLSVRLTKISAHEGFYLLKNALAIPKMTYLLRCASTWRCPSGLAAFDSELRGALESVTNTIIDDKAWSQAALPVSRGGLGIRHVSELAVPAFLASTCSVKDLVSAILPETWREVPDLQFLEGLSKWKKLTALDGPSDSLGTQKRWEEPLVSLTVENVMSTATSPKDKARILGVSSRESGAWLDAYPSPSIGTHMDNDTFRIALSLRLGSPICRPHTCKCGAAVDESGTHGLSCRRSGGRLSRHGAVNDLIKRALSSAETPAILEPPGLSREDGKRPDGMTLVPWSRGRSMVWDFTCVDTLAPSHIETSSKHQGGVAAEAEVKKKTKYLNISNTHQFCPVAIETMGTFGPDSLLTIRELGRRIKRVTGEPRSTSFLLQRLSLAVQRGNAISVLGTLPSSQNLDNCFFFL